MAAIPFMPLYVADYLADTAHLTPQEHGVYLLLIMNYWQTGKPLPADTRRLSKIVKLRSDYVHKIMNVLSEFFVARDGKLIHPRIEKELAKFRQKSDAARLAGQKSGEKRRQQKTNGRSTEPEQTFNGRSTDAERTLNYTDTDTDTEYEYEKNKNFSCAELEVSSSTHDGQKMDDHKEALPWFHDADVRAKLVVDEPLFGAAEEAEPEPEQIQEPIIEIPLTGNAWFAVTDEMVNDWSNLYPAVDVMQELRNIRGWNDAHPRQRKTKRGIRAHINTWLSKAQNQSTKNQWRQNYENSNRPQSKSERHFANCAGDYFKDVPPGSIITIPDALDFSRDKR